MTITFEKNNDFYTITEVTIVNGKSTISTHSFRKYKKDAIINLYKETEELANELKDNNTIHPELDLERLVKKVDAESLNSTLNKKYIPHIREYEEIINQFNFLGNERVTFEEMNKFNTVSNKYGKHGSKSYLEFEPIDQIVDRLLVINNQLYFDSIGVIAYSN